MGHRQVIHTKLEYFQDFTVNINMQNTNQIMLKELALKLHIIWQVTLEISSIIYLFMNKGIHN